MNLAVGDERETSAMVVRGDSPRTPVAIMSEKRGLPIEKRDVPSPREVEKHPIACGCIADQSVDESGDNGVRVASALTSRVI